MKVYALVGKSGTGKSFQATYLCGQMNIEYIIDDGLLIGRASVIAGISAKRQQTKVGAVKTALFTDEAHMREVRDKLAEISPERILVIGTGRNMVFKICDRLGLPAPELVINIEDITTEEERNAAYRQRYEQGKHVIPVPTFELKKEFSGYFMNPLRWFIGRGSKNNDRGERTVVRPTYSYLGKYNISDKVITDIINHICMKSGDVFKVSKISVYKTGEGIKIKAFLVMYGGRNIITAAEKIQSEIAKQTEMMTAFNVEEMNIEIRGLKCS